jgi:hypothetical protein
MESSMGEDGRVMTQDELRDDDLVERFKTGASQDIWR